MDRMRARWILYSATILLGVTAGAPPAAALKAADVLAMNSDQSTGYLFGSMEMASFLAYVAGDKERSRCISQWFNEKRGLSQILEAMEAFKDQQAQPLIYTMMKRACGE